MADYTTNFNLEKPLINEYYDVDVQNRNMDVIDGELNNINTRTANLESNKVDRIDGKSLSTEDYTTLEKSKLFGIDDGANNYVHPSSHPAAIITEDSTHRFVTDMEKSTWNNLVRVRTNVSILSANWVDDTATSGFWIYDIVDANIDANTVVDVNIHLNDLDNAASIKSVTNSFNGYVRLYADEQPIYSIVADLKLVKYLGGA